MISRAYERFTGNQIAKIAQERPDVYADCGRISLVCKTTRMNEYSCHQLLLSLSLLD